jgi:hypothetical protein
MGNGNGINWGVGTGSGLGSGTGSGIGNGNGSGINGGNGTGSGTGSNSNGTDILGNGQNSTDYVNRALNTAGSVLTASAAGSSDAGGKSGGGSSSGKRAYEINQNKNSQNQETNTLSGLIAVILFLIVVLAGYIHNNRKSNKP